MNAFKVDVSNNYSIVISCKFLNQMKMKIHQSYENKEVLHVFHGDQVIQLY